MEFQTVGQMRKYFEDVERRYENGQLRPTSKQGIEDRDRLIECVKEVAQLINEQNEFFQNGDRSAALTIMELVDIRSRLILLLGKFEGFRDAQSFFIALAGSQGQDFN